MKKDISIVERFEK